eukprot:7799357-Alexandrium_andersonii.AAC.1
MVLENLRVGEVDGRGAPGSPSSLGAGGLTNGRLPSLLPSCWHERFINLIVFCLSLRVTLPFDTEG